MSITRVAIIWPMEPWRGAVNYYRNLCSAVSQLPNAKIKLFFFTGEDVNIYDIEDYVEVIRCPMFTRKSLSWVAWKIGVKLNRDVFLYRLMKKHHIDVISHHPSLWQGCPIPSVPWWADFQFLRLPGMFSEQDTADLTSSLKKVCNEEKHILLSSNDAKSDLERFAKSGVSPSVHVLPFISALIEQNDVPKKDELVDTYELPELWFYLPNQFWKHKNHKVVIDALGEMKRRGKAVCVVATGKKDDFRNPEHYQYLINDINKLGVCEDFISLGEVPFKDVASLMFYSVAVINPSLFEGWSTTVEESKALGKRIILSDIPVHREQSPKRGIYFSPTDAGDLADVLCDVMKKSATVSEAMEALAAKEEYGNEVMAFARRYEKIIGEVLL